MAGAAACAALVVGAVGVARPSPVKPEPGPPAVVRSLPVWADGAGIHIGGRTYRPADDARVHNLAVVAGGVVYTEGGGEVWFQPRVGAATRIGQGEPATLSGGGAGSTVAWVEKAGRTATLVVFDTGRLEETARVQVVGRLLRYWAFSGDHVANSSPFFHVDEDEVVYATFKASEFTHVRYDVTSGEHEVFLHDGDHHLLLDVAGSASVRLSPSDDFKTHFRRTLTFEDRGGELISKTYRAEPTGVFSPDGTRFAGVFPAGRHTTYVGVVDVGTGAVRPMTEDSRLYPRLAWGTGETLMVRRTRTTPGPAFAELLACEADQLMSCSAVPAADWAVLPTS